MSQPITIDDVAIKPDPDDPNKKNCKILSFTTR
jgi:hypothetical protein